VRIKRHQRSAIVKYSKLELKPFRYKHGLRPHSSLTTPFRSLSSLSSLSSIPPSLNPATSSRFNTSFLPLLFVMTERYPPFNSPLDSKSDAAISSVSDTHALSRGPVEESIQGSSSETHQQAPLQVCFVPASRGGHELKDEWHQRYDLINHNSTTHDNPVLWTRSPVHPNHLGNSPNYSALGIDGLTSPYPHTTSYNDLNFSGNDLSSSPMIPPASYQGVQSYPPPSLQSAHHQINDIYSRNMYNQGYPDVESSVRNELYQGHYLQPLVQTPQFQPDIAHTLNFPPTSGVPWMGEHTTTPFLAPNLRQVYLGTDAHLPTPNGPQGSSLSTPDGSMSIPVLSSGSSPSLSHHHPTPSSMSSSILYTPDQYLHHPENCCQSLPYITDYTSSQQRPAESLTSCQFTQNASHPSAMKTKQTEATRKNTPHVPGYRKIAPASPSCLKPQVEDSPRQEKRRVRRGSKGTRKLPRGTLHNSTTQSLPAGTVVFTRPLTPTTIHKHSFDTSSRKVDERMIERVGLNSEAGHSIAPKVQEELWRSDAPSHVRSHANERTLATSHAFSRQRRSSKEAKTDGSPTTSKRRTSIQSPPAEAQNTGTLPTLGKRQKRHTTDSNSSTNSSKTSTRRSRTNSNEDEKLTSSSSQQIGGSFDGCTRSVGKNSGRVGGETGAVTSAPRTVRVSPLIRVSSSRTGIPIEKYGSRK